MQNPSKTLLSHVEMLTAESKALTRTADELLELDAWARQEISRWICA